MTPKLHTELRNAVYEAKSLRELRDALHRAEDLIGRGYDVELDIDLTWLPVFGGLEPSDTLGIFSWDPTHLLEPGLNGGWTIDPRPDPDEE